LVWISSQYVRYQQQKERALKITLISLIEDVFTPSLRFLSSYLNAQGHATTLIYLPWGYTDKTLNATNSFLYPYPQSVLDQIAEMCKTSDLVGISLMTCHFDNAVYITKFLRGKLSIPIIWGGIHPSIRPAECLEYADMVCLGEGEHSLSQLAKEMAEGKPWNSSNVRGILKQSNPIFVASPIVEDLNQIPFPDYNLEHQFVLYEGNLARLDSRGALSWIQLSSDVLARLSLQLHVLLQ
jgi:hypothetical protein